MSEIFDTRSFPFDRSVFPSDLGAVVIKTVLNGELPALQVVHTPDNRWAIGDGLHDPNEPEACEVAHIWHVLQRDATLRQLSTLPVGYQADREGVGSPWVIRKFDWLEDNP
jgi:hypothetical protein